MPNDDYMMRGDALKAILSLSIYDSIEELDGARTVAENTWADGLYDAYKIIEEEVDSADVEPKRRWIPMTEQFPKPVSAQTRRKTKPVLLYSPKGGFYVGWYFGEDYRGHHIFASRTSKDSLQYITTKVTHWMPTYEEPKEDT